MSIEDTIKAIYEAGYQDRMSDNSFDPMGCEIVCKTITEMQGIMSSTLQLLELFKDQYSVHEYSRIKELLTEGME